MKDWCHRNWKRADLQDDVKRFKRLHLAEIKSRSKPGKAISLLDWLRLNKIMIVDYVGFNVQYFGFSKFEQEFN